MSLRLMSTFTPIFLALAQKADFPLHVETNCILMNHTNLSKSNITFILDVIWLCMMRSYACTWNLWNMESLDQNLVKKYIT